MDSLYSTNDSFDGSIYLNDYRDDSDDESIYPKEDEDGENYNNCTKEYMDGKAIAWIKKNRPYMWTTPIGFMRSRSFPHYVKVYIRNEWKPEECPYDGSTYYTYTFIDKSYHNTRDNIVFYVCSGSAVGMILTAITAIACMFTGKRKI
jgi:hypothetical protein